MLITFERLETWPDKSTTDRKSAARFTAAYQTIKADLEDEVARIEGYNVLLEADIIPQGILARSRAISKSGWPYAGTNAKSHPGVRLSFTVNMDRVPTRLEFACDAYDGWLANLRGISLTLTALRDIKRHGATRNQQQYAGFRKALPSAGGDGSSEGNPKVGTGRTIPLMNADYAADILVGACITAGRSFDRNAVRNQPDAAQQAYRCAAGYFHPDCRTGNAERFVQITAAIEKLRAVLGSGKK